MQDIVAQYRHLLPASFRAHDKQSKRSVRHHLDTALAAPVCCGYPGVGGDWAPPYCRLLTCTRGVQKDDAPIMSLLLQEQERSPDKFKIGSRKCDWGVRKAKCKLLI
jgi:hypothetical protein